MRAPRSSLLASMRWNRTVFKAVGCAGGRAVRAPPCEIGGMVGIARYGRAAAIVWRRQTAAADAAIGTGRAHGAKSGIDGRHLNNRIRPPLTGLRASGRT